MVDYPSLGKEIDNDYHPKDSDLSATNDHWGTVHTDARSMLEDRNRTTTYGGVDSEGYHFSGKGKK